MIRKDTQAPPATWGQAKGQADILVRLSPDARADMLAQLPPETRREVEDLLRSMNGDAPV